MGKKDADRELVEGWARDLRLTGQVEVRPGRGRIVIFLVGAIALTLGCLGAALDADELKTVLAGWAGVVLFGLLGIPTLCKSIFGDRDTVTVDPVGVTSHGVLVPWQEIVSVGHGQSGRNTYVMLGVSPQFLETTSQQGSLVARGIAAANRRLSDGEFVYLPSVLRHPVSLAAWLAAEAQARAGSPSRAAEG